MSRVSIQMATRSQQTTVIRNTNAGETDAGGQPLPPDWETYLTDVPCFAWVNTTREPDNAGRVVVIEDRRAILPSGIDVTELDQLGDIITRQDGSIYMPGPMNILGVETHLDHLELLLEAVRG